MYTDDNFSYFTISTNKNGHAQIDFCFPVGSNDCFLRKI